MAGSRLADLRDEAVTHPHEWLPPDLTSLTSGTKGITILISGCLADLNAARVRARGAQALDRSPTVVAGAAQEDVVTGHGEAGVSLDAP